MIARFQFYDLNYNVTADYQGGSPLIRVSVAVDFQPVLHDVLALIDTGSNVTIIHPDVVRNFTPVATIPTQTAAGPIQVNQYAGTVTITDLEDTVGGVISAQPTRHHAIIGRDVLRHYRMIYDPLKPEFFLEKP